MKKGLAIIVLFLIVGILSFTTIRYITLKNHCTDIVSQLQNGNVSILDKARNGVDLPEEFLDYADYLSNENLGQENELLTKIVSNSEISIDVSFFSNTVTYSFNVPNMEEYIKVTRPEVKTEKELMDSIDTFIQTGNKLTRTAALTYTYKDNHWTANYRSKEFLDALSGGFITGYNELYQDMLDSYKNSLGE